MVLHGARRKYWCRIIDPIDIDEIGARDGPVLRSFGLIVAYRVQFCTSVLIESILRVCCWKKLQNLEHGFVGATSCCNFDDAPKLILVDLIWGNPCRNQEDRTSQIIPE